MRTAKLALATFLLCLMGLVPCLKAESASPLHLSLSEAICNRERGRLQINVRVQTADLEAILSERAKRKISASDLGELAPLALEYVREKLRLTTAAGESLRLEWAGQDLADKQLFLFFEAPLKGGLPGLKITNTLFLEAYPDQVNSVELRDGAIKQTLVFSQKATELVVSTKP